jgi:hypothetical protein
LNLSAAVERALEERSRQIQLAVPAPPQAEAAGSLEVQKTRQQALQQERRQRRLERYEEVIQLYRQGCSQKKISESPHPERKTMRRWIRAGQFPERKSPRGRPTKVQRFTEYLQRRWAEGCHNATRLFEEIRPQNYRGGRSMVARHVATWRNSTRPVPAVRPQKITPKHAAILITKALGQLTVEQQELLDQLSAQCPDLLRLRKLSAEFREVFRGGESQALQAWTKNAEHSGIGSLARFAAGIERFRGSAVRCENLLEQWPGGGAGQPSEDPQTPEVRPRWLRTPARSRPTLRPPTLHHACATTRNGMLGPRLILESAK